MIFLEWIFPGEVRVTKKKLCGKYFLSNFNILMFAESLQKDKMNHKIGNLVKCERILNIRKDTMLFIFKKSCLRYFILM